MQIFHLVPNMNYGGLQEVVRGLTLCQSQAGHSVTVGCWSNTTNHPEAERELKRAGVRVTYLKRSADGSLSYDRMSVFKNVRGHLGGRNADVLHVHNPFGYYLYGAIAARLQRGTRIVNTIHATVMFDERARKAAGARSAAIVRTKAQFWMAAILTDGLVSVCSEVQAVIRKKFVLPAGKLFVVENGIDLSRFLVVPARVPGKEIVFGTVGRMSSEKNHQVLIEAFAMARRKHSNIRLRLLGGGPLEPKLKELAGKLGLQDAVEFCGFSDDVPGFLLGLDVFVLPSNSEGLPMSLLEAIASGLPVVATAVGGVPRIVQNTDSGWLCAPQNADDLREAIEKAVAFPGLRDRGERARKLVAEQYSAERMTRDYEKVYQKLLERRA